MNPALELLTSFWVLQSAVALIKTRNARRLFTVHQRGLAAGVKPHEPRRVALIIAVKGVSENFGRFMEFALGQDYPDYQVLFVTESENDPAHAEIQRRLCEGTRARRIVSLIGTAIEPLIGPNWRMCLWGGSMAMTREVFDELEVPKNLHGCINDDARISQLARQAGKRMRYFVTAVLT